MTESIEMSLLLPDVLGHSSDAPVPGRASTLISRLLSDLTCYVTEGSNDISVDPSTLSNRWKLKEHPESSSNNLRIDNLEEGFEELIKMVDNCMSSVDEMCILDVSTAETGRNINGLRVIAKRLNQHCNNSNGSGSGNSEKKVHIYYCTSPFSGGSGGVTQDEEAMTARMKSELFGGHMVQADLFIKAAAVALQIDAPYFNGCLSSELDAKDITAIRACGRLHKDLREAQTVEGGAQTAVGIPPIIISTSPQFTQHEAVAVALSTAGADISRVVLANITGSLSRLDYWDDFLTRHTGCYLCIDGFGHGATFSPPPYRTSQTSGSIDYSHTPHCYPPNDAEILAFIVALCTRGHALRVILSLSIFCKIQLEMYGKSGALLVSE